MGERMNFDIRLSLTEKEMFEEYGVEGEVEINGSIEKFFAPIGYWHIKDYYKNWMLSLEDAWKRNRPAVFIVGMRSPENSNFLFSWVLYFEEDKAYIHNVAIFCDEMKNGFGISQFNDHIGPREIINEDGKKISEWEITRNDVVDFFNRLQTRLQRGASVDI
jgi:hypothetical protein